MSEIVIAHMTYGLLDNATDLAEIWLHQPWHRREFGEREVKDIREAHLKLGLLLSAIEVKEVA